MAPHPFDINGAAPSHGWNSRGRLSLVGHVFLRSPAWTLGSRVLSLRDVECDLLLLGSSFLANWIFSSPCHSSLRLRESNRVG